MSNEVILPPGSSSGRSPSVRRRLSVAGAAVCLLALAATACSSAAGSTGGSSAATTDSVANVTLNVGDQGGSGEQALLTAAGLINKLPFKVHFADFTSGPPILQAMASGSVDIGGVGNAPPVFSAASNSPIAVISALTTNVNDAAIVVPKDSPIHSVAQLKGKTVAVATGTLGNYLLLAALTKAGLTIKDVKADNLQPPDAEAAFTAGHVAAWAIWAPFSDQAEVASHARVIANLSGLGGNYSFVVASRAALNNPAKAAAIKDYLKLLNQAYAWAGTHQSAWAATWAKATGLPSAVMLKAVQDSSDVPTPINSTVLSSEQSVANAFYSAGLIPAKVDFSKFAVTTFNAVTEESS